MTNIPKCMSTQHPDNAHAPAYATNGVIKGEGEIAEAVEVFQLGCDEQMWDSEGKDADNRVVQKLLSNHADFFRDGPVLGRDCMITLRVPNPAIELEMRKSLVEALQGIPTACDVSDGFYGANAEPPIQEIILPFTTNSNELALIAAYYEQYIVGQQDQLLVGETSVRDWIGEFRPKAIRVIPLIEDLEHMVTADTIVREFLETHNVPYQRVFLARSDPALNYGSVGAELMLKIGLQRLSALEEDLGIPIYPIIGAGAVPFRGHLSPRNVGRALSEYPSAQTFTAQSAFKFDHPVDIVRAGIQQILGHERSAPHQVDEPRAKVIIDKVAAEYQSQVRRLAPIIAKASPLVPRRRERKLHVGLFGYGRTLSGSADVTLPRAIAFAASLYSLGVPPEILGMTALDAEDIAFLNESYPNLSEDLSVALRFVNEYRVNELLGSEYAALVTKFASEIDRVHEGLTTAIWESLDRNTPTRVTHFIEEAAQLRHFLG